MTETPMKQLLTAFFVVVLLVMLWIIVVASQDRGVLAAAFEMWADPWGKATLLDLYASFFTVWIWMAFREPNWPRRLLWLALLVCLGSVAIALYFLLALWQLPPGAPWSQLFRPLRPSPEGRPS